MTAPLAELELGEGERLDVLGQIDAAALDGLRRDGLLRSSLDDPFSIGPEFAHDELRRYAIARLLLVGRDPAGRLRRAGAPRWTLAAARLACQTVLAQPDAPSMSLKGRLAAQQSAFDDLAREGHGSRWGDVPGEALLALADPEPLLRDAWPELVGNEAAGLRRLARLVEAVGELPYLYREVADRSIMWWDPVAWTSEVEAWLPLAVGKGICVGQLVGFLGVLPPEQQLSVGLSWIERLVLTDPAGAARSSGILAAWLVEMRPLAVDAELWKSWQIVVDALVVAGVTRLAPYSD